MAKEIEFCEDLIKYLEKHGFHELMNVPVKYKDGINTTQVQFYPKEFKNIRELKPETPFVGFEIDDETDGFVRGWLSDKGVTTKKVYYDTYDELDSFFKRITESKTSAKKSIKESTDDIITVKEFCFWGHGGNIVEIWTIDGVLCDSFEVRNVGKSEYKNYEIHGWDCAKNTVIIYIKK